MRTLRFVAYVVDIVTSIIMILLGVRLAFMMFNANAAAPLVRSVYVVTDPMLIPFRGIFSNQVLSPGFVIEFSALLAVVAYALLGSIIIRVADALAETRTPEGAHSPLAT